MRIVRGPERIPTWLCTSAEERKKPLYGELFLQKGELRNVEGGTKACDAEDLA